MVRRWRLLIGLGLFLLVGIVLAFPSVHWRLIGWAKGEAFFQGRPTSWWAAECRQWQYRPDTDGSDLILSSWLRTPTWMEQKLRSASPPPDSMPLLQSDPGSLAVLIELAEHDDREILTLTAHGVCGVLGDHPKLILDAAARSDLIKKLRRMASRPDRDQAWELAKIFAADLESRAAKNGSPDR